MQFHPIIQEWFERSFAHPTETQDLAWKEIIAGRDVLISAPTGSGKTLAAFLACLDRLVRAALEGSLLDETEVVYVSPLKALSNDIQKNLERPLQEIAKLAGEKGLLMPPLRVAVRTGDTPMAERQQMIKRPPHILVTTPESLFILLTAERSRNLLKTTKTFIIDEIHALVEDKRGAHLALSAARLDDLVMKAGRRYPQRIGLSATVRPIEEVAKFVSPDKPLQIIDRGHRRQLDLAVEVPKDELGPVASNEMWAEIYDRISELILAHRTTLVFVNTRRRAIRGVALDALQIPPWPLDVLAQQIVYAAACESWNENDLFELVCRAYPYRDLPREDFDAIIEMLSEGIATQRGRSGAFLHRDQINNVVRGRRGARLAAITSGGAIPENANYFVVAEPEETIVGTLDEDFAVESLAGDVFLLGTTSWRIRRVEAGRVRVEDARGAAPSIPFWRGEAPGRTIELSRELSLLREEIARSGACPDACGLDRRGAEQAVEYVLAGRAALGAVPSTERVVAECFFDEGGGMQLVIHAPFGARINRAWGLALRKRFCRSFNFELQAAATDNGIVISLGEQHSFPLDIVFEFLRPATVQEVLTQ